MRKIISIMLTIITIISCLVCMTACQKRDGELEEASRLLMNDTELNAMFSSIRVSVYNGRQFDVMLVFKDKTSEMIKNLSKEEACELSKKIHDKIRDAVIEVGYDRISSIGAMMYGSDWVDLADYYILSFDVGRANKTYVKIWKDAYNPLWEEEVPWGGFGELE